MSDESNLQPQLLTEVSDAYYRAIGRVTVEFSHLESTLLYGCAVLLETPTADQAFIVISQLQFPRLLSSFCSLFAQKFGPGKQVRAMLKTFQAVAGQSQDRRNQVAHSIWAMPKSADERILRRKFHLTSERVLKNEAYPMSVEEVDAIADQILAAVNAANPLFALIHERYMATRPAPGFPIPPYQPKIPPPSNDK